VSLKLLPFLIGVLSIHVAYLSFLTKLSRVDDRIAIGDLDTHRMAVMQAYLFLIVEYYIVQGVERFQVLLICMMITIIAITEQGVCQQPKKNKKVGLIL